MSRRHSQSSWSSAWAHYSGSELPLILVLSQDLLHGLSLRRGEVVQLSCVHTQGLWSGLVVGYVTCVAVRKIAETRKQSAAADILYGLALGFLSCIIPVICWGVSILLAHTLRKIVGVALGALGMPGTMTMALTTDARGATMDYEIMLESVLQGNEVGCSRSSKDAAEAGGKVERCTV